jgi:hypothetical protein
MMNRSLPKQVWLLTASLIVLIAILTSGCSDATTPTENSPTPPFPQESTSTATSWVTSTPEATPTEQIALTPTPEPLERPQYKITASLDYLNRQVSVKERILVSNPAGIPLSEMDLVVPPNNWGGVFTIQDINAGDKALESFSLDVITLHLEFSEPAWQPGEILELTIQYSLDLPRQNSLPGYGPSPFGYTDRQTNLVDWYPMVPPYQEGEGWVIHDPWIFGEHLVYPAADFEVNLDLGIPGLVVAASSLPVGTNSVPPVGDSVLQYSLEEARNFVFSISPEYEVWVTDSGDLKILGYFFPGYQTPSQAAFDATVQSLVIYQDLYGPYQHPSLTMVQGDFDHGMEYEGLYFLSNAFYDIYNGTEKSYLVAIAVHETAHQWWYGQVANDQALEPWLDEALCTFSELAFYENQYPESVDWWWATRVNFYQPEGRIDRSIYGFQEYVDQYLNYRNATYLQGAKFLAALKDEMGEEVFYGFLREYGKRYRDQIATSQDFFALLGEYIDLEQLTWLGEYFLIE